MERSASPDPKTIEQPSFPGAEAHTILARDGVRLYYEVIGRSDAHAPTVLFANGLGARLYAWKPLVDRLRETHRLISWDYRGLFRSTAPEKRKSLAIVKHAEDALRILDAEGVRQATVVGWSMGVQVGLEAAAEAPERIDKLVLLNGTHGHALETAFQPLARVPGLPPVLHAVLERAHHPILAGLTRLVARSSANVQGFGGLMALLRRNPRIVEAYRQYVEDVFGESYPNYLRLFQELNAHSVYHLLPEIRHEALVISGGLDPLTPAYQSFEIARRMPRAKLLHLPLASHFAILEAERTVCDAIVRFLGLAR